MFLERERVIVIQPQWTLVEAIQAAYAAYRGWGPTSKGHKMAIIKAWGNIVGRRRAVVELEELYRRAGSRKALASQLWISTKTLRELDKHFRAVPTHRVLAPGAPSADLLAQLTYSGTLGGGAYGKVWAAKDALGRDVAVKFMYPDDPGANEMAFHHAQALAMAEGHTNIVKIHHCTVLEHPVRKTMQTGIVMEKLHGSTLLDLTHN